MTVVLDTSILVDHLRRHQPARDALVRAAGTGERIVGSVLTIVEILAGMRPTEAAATASLLAQVEWVSVDERLAERAGELGQRYLRSHPGVDPVDLVIAATVEQLDAELWTRNIRHFPMVDRVRSPY